MPQDIDAPDRFEHNIDHDDIPAPVLDAVDVRPKDRVDRRMCAGCEDHIYSIPNAGADVGADGKDKSPIHCMHDVNRATAGYIPENDGWEWYCDSCFMTILERGSRVRAIDARGERTEVRTHHGALAAHPGAEHNDIDLTDHACQAGVEAIVLERDEIPLPDGVGGGDDHGFVSAFDGYKRPRLSDVPAGYRGQEAFIEAVFTKRVSLDAPAIAIGSHLYVPEEAVDAVRTAYEAFHSDSKKVPA